MTAFSGVLMLCKREFPADRGLSLPSPFSCGPPPTPPPKASFWGSSIAVCSVGQGFQQNGSNENWAEGLHKQSSTVCLLLHPSCCSPSHPHFKPLWRVPQSLGAAWGRPRRLQPKGEGWKLHLLGQHSACGMLGSHFKSLSSSCYCPM